MSKFGDNLRRYREEAGLTQKDLAKAMGYKSTSTIAKMETGVNAVGIDVAIKLAQILGTTPAKLAGWVTDETDGRKLISIYNKLNDQGKRYLLQQALIAQKLYGKEDEIEF